MAFLRSLFGEKTENLPGGMRNLYGIKENDEVTAANEKYFGDAGDSIHHSRYYHRYYEGYTEIRTPNPDSRFKPYKIQRIYTAPYTVPDLDGRDYRIRMIYYGLLAAAAVLLYVSAFTDRNVAMNTVRQLAAGAVLVTLVPLFLMSVSLIAYWLRPKRMKYYDYRTSTRRLKLTSVISAGGCLLAALGFCVYLFAAGSANLTAELLYIGRLIAASGACFALFRMERRMPYRQIPNDVTLPEGEYHRIQ